MGFITLWWKEKKLVLWKRYVFYGITSWFLFLSREPDILFIFYLFVLFSLFTENFYEVVFDMENFTVMCHLLQPPVDTLKLKISSRVGIFYYLFDYFLSSILFLLFCNTCYSVTCIILILEFMDLFSMSLFSYIISLLSCLIIWKNSLIIFNISLSNWFFNHLALLLTIYMFIYLSWQFLYLYL